MIWRPSLSGNCMDSHKTVLTVPLQVKAHSSLTSSNTRSKFFLNPCKISILQSSLWFKLCSQSWLKLSKNFWRMGQAGWNYFLQPYHNKGRTIRTSRCYPTRPHFTHCWRFFTTNNKWSLGLWPFFKVCLPSINPHLHITSPRAEIPKVSWKFCLPNQTKL